MARQPHKTSITDEAMAILRGKVRENLAGIDVTAVAPTVEMLNSLSIFKGRIRFQSLRRRGSMIQARFEGGAEALWRTATDLVVFSRSQAIIFDATGVLISTPSARKIRATWEPVAQLLRRVADQDSVATGPGLADEFAQIIRSTWERAGHPDATADADMFLAILQECNTHQRDHAGGPPRCCVWIGEESAWIHQPSLLDWLSCPVAKSKHYPWDDVRAALLLLDFVPRELHRSLGGQGIHVRVWRGPLDLLTDDETNS
jgi:hypothetical protein